MEKLGIDGKLLLAQLINFGLFSFIFVRFIAKPFRQFVEGEKKAEEQKEKLMAEIKKEEESMEKSREKFKDEMKKESAKLIEEAKESAKSLKEEMVLAAGVEVEEMKEKTKKQLEIERAKMEAVLKEKIVDLSFYVVEKGFKEALTDDVRKKVTEKILKNLPKKIDLYEN